jgi:hypothetical protein
MLVAGMGLSLYGIAAVLADSPDPELESFMDACLRTYAHYQTPAGYFVSATGWHNEADVAPSTAWHAHDLFFLMGELKPRGSFWDDVFTDHPRQSVLLSDRAVWAEDGNHWCILSPYTAGDLSIYGRKDRDTFGRSYFAWTDKEALPAQLEYSSAPAFFVADDGIYRLDHSDRPTDVTTVGPYRYRGHISEV